jgi:acyl-CoA thioesterase-1
MSRSIALGCSAFAVTLIAILLFLVLSKDSRAQSPPGEPKGAPSGIIIVAFGDSLTQGHVLSEKDAYPAQLEGKLMAEGLGVKVINAGVNGETSSGALSRLQWILKLKPDIVILETGANDGFRGIKPELIERNIREIVRILKENGVTVVLAGMQMLSNLGEEYTAAFKAVYPRVAQDQALILIPFFLEGVAGEPGLNLPDGIHPTAEGHRMVADHVFPFVMEAVTRIHGKGANDAQ